MQTIKNKIKIAIFELLLVRGATKSHYLCRWLNLVPGLFNDVLEDDGLEELWDVEDGRQDEDRHDVLEHALPRTRALWKKSATSFCSFQTVLFWEISAELLTLFPISIA